MTLIDSVTIVSLIVSSKFSLIRYSFMLYLDDIVSANKDFKIISISKEYYKNILLRFLSNSNKSYTSSKDTFFSYSLFVFLKTSL